MSKHSTSKRSIVAVDFGTAGTGFSYKPLNENRTSAPKCGQWGNGNESKTTTFVIAKSRNARCPIADPKHPLADIELVDYGFNAEAHEVPDNQEVYRGFKMCLYAEDYYGHGEDSNVTEFAANGRPVCRSINNNTPTDCINVIAALLEKMKESAIDRLRSSGLEDITVSEILWILTVPAIWSPESKNWMRTAAIQAGLPESPDDTKMCLEPEAAAIHCLNDPNLGLKENDVFIVLDAGGGTVDVVVFKMGPNKTMTQLKGYPASGGDWGSQYIDRNFDALLVEIFGEKNVSYAKSYEGYRQVYESFVRLKNEYTGSPADYYRLNVSTLCFLSGKGSKWSTSLVRKKIQKYSAKYAEPILFESGYLCLTERLMKKMFEPVVQKTVHHLQDLIMKVNPKHVLVVGGFAQSPYLKTEMESLVKSCSASLKSEVNVYFPDRAGSAVLEGAVWYGIKPEAVTGRVCRYTYGVSCLNYLPLIVAMLVGEGNEDEKRKSQLVEQAMNSFTKFVTKGEVVQANAVVEHDFSPASEESTCCHVNIFSSINEDPRSTIEKGCHHLATVVVPMTREEGEDMTDRTLRARFLFGGTQIHVSVIDVAKGKEVYTEVDFNAHGNTPC